MTLPPPTGGQSSIRSFFQPKQPPTYPSAPPSAPAGAATASPPPPPSAPQAAAPPSPTPSQQLQQEHKQSIPSPPPPPPPPAAAAAAAASPRAAVPVPAPKPTHHPNVTISPILPSHIPALRRMTARILPVRYPDSFWEPLLDPESSGAFSRVLLWHERGDDDAGGGASSSSSSSPTVIGGLVCRPEPVFQARPGEMADLVPDALYIQSLVLLEPYRRLGLAGAMLDDVCARAARDPRRPCRTVCAHVWTPNQEGMDWYLARGFARVEPVVAAYYRMLDPSDAWIVRRDIAGGAVLDALRGAAAAASSSSSSSPPLPVPTPAVASFTRAAPPPPLPPSSSSSPSPSGPPPGSAAARPAPPRTPSASGTSFQNTRPETEWNDLPADMARNLAVPGSGASSGASSRSSSAMRKKRDKRAYPAAAFGNPS